MGLTPHIPRYEIIVSPLGDATPAKSSTGAWCQWPDVEAALVEMRRAVGPELVDVLVKVLRELEGRGRS